MAVILLVLLLIAAIEAMVWAITRGLERLGR